MQQALPSSSIKQREILLIGRHSLGHTFTGVQNGASFANCRPTIKVALGKLTIGISSYAHIIPEIRMEYDRSHWQAAPSRTVNCVQSDCEQCGGLSGQVRVVDTAPSYAYKSQQPRYPSRSIEIVSPDRCHIATLPDELLLEILAYLVPTRMTFHIYRKANYRQPVTIINGFGDPKTAQWPPAPWTDALASVSRKFSSLFLGMLYGQNSWVVECSDADSCPVVLDSDLNKPSPLSWGRLLGRRSDDRWPFCAVSARYVKDLTIIVRLADLDSLDPYAQHVGSVQLQLEKVVSVIGPDLRRLDIDIELVSKSKCWLPQSKLRCVRRKDGTHQVRLQSSTSSDQDFAQAMPLWRTLDGLRGIKEVHLSGMITEEAAKVVGKRLQTQPDLAPDGNQVWEVEKIVRERVRAGVREYRLRWTGFDLHSDTWETDDAFDEMGELIMEWEESRWKAGSSSKRKRTSERLKSKAVRDS
ncbi:hypothetical protein LTS10_002335 [Elasticomyces elasticus]|nr:hypothetical protein LTS10_002335 [Elasticomyces elasticus]